MARQDTSDGGSKLGQFLRARRARVGPEDVGMPVGSGLRRTPGLRREELAAVAGVSADYYARLERGTEKNPSSSVVDALARALMLDRNEHEHLRTLAAHASRTAFSDLSPAPSRTVNPSVKLLLEHLRPNPAFIVSRTGDLLAWTPSGLRLLAGMDQWPARRRNIARYVFLHPQARDLFGKDWLNQVSGMVGRLRALAGIDPDAEDLAQLAGELLVKSPEFAQLWDRYDVTGNATGRKTMHHPELGDVTLCYQSMHLDGTPDHRLITYYAEPGTSDHDAVVLLDMTAQEHAAHATRASDR
ncbi:helix-turn-helix transcriptional regulator [Streptomyces sp. NPDC057690]|uniref:helix-turn-helix transcriptional regulator n=1 Tax=Streptomyces sp. NPDC057690 TaxID=3346214 RepID=UPI0036875529